MTEIALSIITDCADPNARARQELAYNQLFDNPSLTFLGVDTATSKAPELEVAGNLVDQLDVLSRFGSGDRDSGIVAQVAQRGSEIKLQHDNGPAFCFFEHKNTLVAATLNNCLVFARDEGLVRDVEVVDIPTVVEAAVQDGRLTREEAETIANTQFRSLEFLPLLMRWVKDNRNVPSKTVTLTEDVLPPAKPVIWHIDNFGNGKSNMHPEAIGFEDGMEVELACGKLAVCHTRLADVRTGEAALTVGSSGYGKRKWLEVVVGKGRADTKLSLSVGTAVLKEHTESPLLRAA